MRRRHVLGAAAGACLAPALAQPAARLTWPELRLLDGSILRAADWDDVAAVIVVFATWCPFCQRHNAHVQALHQAYGGAHLRVIGAAIDRDESAVRRYVERQGLTFGVTMQGAQLRDLAGARAMIPTTIAVDRAGRLRTPIPGEMFREDVLEFAALAQAPGLAYHR